MRLTQSITKSLTLPRILPIQKISRNLAALAASLLLLSCTTAPERVEYAEVVLQNESLRIEQPDRVIVDFEADCTDGLCEVSENNLSIIVTVISKLNDNIEKRVDAHNRLVDALIVEQMAKHRQREAKEYCHIAAEKQQLISTIKQGLWLAVCGAGLIYK